MRRPAADDAARRPVPARWRRDVRRRAAAAVGEAGAARRPAIASSWRCGRCSSRPRGAGCSSTAAPATRWTRSSATSTRSIGRAHLDHALAEAGLTRRRDRRRARDAPALRSLRRRHRPRRTAGLTPRFPQARYLIRAAEWEDATHPHERNRASYLQDDFVPLKDAGVVDFFDGDDDDQAGRARRAHRRPHRAAPDRLPRVRRQDGGVRRRSDPDDRAPPGRVGHGLRPVSRWRRWRSRSASSARPSTAST